jgi:uncharacterized protein (TIRG00374 family)
LWRSRRVWIGLAVSLIFIVLFLYGTNFQEIGDAFADANYLLAFLSLPVYFLAAWFRTLRWKFLLRPLTNVSTVRLYPVVIIGFMANNLIPARVGEVVRAYILRERERVGMGASLGTIVVDRLFDGLTLIPLLAAAAAFAGRDVSFPIVGGLDVGFQGLAVLMAALFGIAFVLLLILAVSPAWRDRADRLSRRLTPSRLRPAVEGLLHSFFDGLRALRSPVDMALAGGASVISWLLEATMYYMVGQAFNLDVGFHVYLLVTAAANLAIAVLASQGGVGPFEFVTKKTVIAFGVGAGPATAYAVALHALLLLPVIALGLFFLWYINLSLGDMLRRPAAASEMASTGPVEPPRGGHLGMEGRRGR